MSTSERQVAIIDDEPSVRRSLQRLLATEGYAVKTFESASEYLGSGLSQQPVCVVLDIRMPGMSGIQLQEELVNRGRADQIVFITGHGDVPICAQAMKIGAVDFLTKPFTDDALLSAVACATSRAQVKWQHDVARAQARKVLDALTERELEVFRWIISGLLNKQIAAEIGTTEKTVKVHRGRITTKLGIMAVADMVRLAMQAGVTPASSIAVPQERAS